ncbi:unnamed protein product [Rhizoctonia solani]|uniref:Uncharacterized protein n=1 Tax=Rhizoctonia solani TaxID=456999 RepID=A0A8H3C7N8_9AGAM|nr:unnamed protein product [Rhizoctonia solani]
MRPELPIVAFISTALVLIPLPWHWRAGNIGTLSLIFWLASINLTRGINADYVVQGLQGHRFDIIEDFGCNPTDYMPVASLFLAYLPSLALALITLVYSGIALRWFFHRRTQFQAVLQSSNSGLATGRYLRLIALSITEMLLATAMTTFVIVVIFEDGDL